MPWARATATCSWNRGSAGICISPRSRASRRSTCCGLSDDFDRFADPARAFAYVDATAARTGIPGDTATYSPGVPDGSRAGTMTRKAATGRRSCLRPGAWKRLTEGEIGDRAAQDAGRVKYVHNLIGASEAAIEAYKVVNERWFNNPYDGIADLFINFEGGISTLDGDPHLGNWATSLTTCKRGRRRRPCRWNCWPTAAT